VPGILRFYFILAYAAGGSKRVKSEGVNGFGKTGHARPIALCAPARPGIIPDGRPNDTLPPCICMATLYRVSPIILNENSPSSFG
jgi:hypothetical protein